MSFRSSYIGQAGASKHAAKIAFDLAYKLRLVGFLCVLVMAVSAQSLSALSSQELSRVTFVNETGVSIRYLFSSSTGTSKWGPDLLGPRSFAYGASISYYLHYRNSHEFLDFLALDKDGDAYLIQGRKIVDGTDPVVRIGRGNYIGSYRDFRTTRVNVTNATNRSFSYLFFAPKEAKDWGFDLLNDSTTLESGDTLSFAVPVGTKDQLFEILVLGKDQTVVQRQVSLAVSKPEVYIDITFNDLH